MIPVTVAPGDTLSSIAAAYGTNWQAIAAYSALADPNLIYAGQTVYVPTSTGSPAPVTTTAAVSPSAPGPASLPTTTTTTATTTTTTPTTTTATTTTAPAGAASVQADLASGNNLLAAGQFLVANGYTPAAAAGIVSCIDGESGGNPESVGSGGGGLIGWTPISSASPNANIITGNPVTDMMTQLQDVLSYNNANGNVAALNAQTDPVAAADFYSQNFERPAVTNSDVVASVAQQIYAALGS